MTVIDDGAAPAGLGDPILDKLRPGLAQVVVVRVEELPPFGVPNGSVREGEGVVNSHEL